MDRRLLIALLAALAVCDETAAQDEPVGRQPRQGARPGELRKDNRLAMPLAWIPPGQFKMGSPPEEVSERQLPRVDVLITRGLWLGTTEVTQSQWVAVMKTEPWSGHSVPEGPAYPAMFIDWFDAWEFCRRLTEHEQTAQRVPPFWEYRLPTEAEWEYACRAGTDTLYSFGDDDRLLSDYAWWGGNRGLGGNAEHAHRVGVKKSNAWGMYDMHGNVWEWCLDGYRDLLMGGRDPVFNGGSMPVGRGGSWRYYSWSCRSAFRSHRPLTRPGGDTNGFRVALGHTTGSSLGLLSVARSARSTTNLEQIGRGLRRYHGAYAGFPAAYNTDESGKSLLSWRVHVLPFIGRQDLYEKFRLDESWNSEHNRKLIRAMPQLYAAPGSSNPRGKTNYLAIRCKDSVIARPVDSEAGKTSPTSTLLDEILDGVANTISLVEAADVKAVIWTQPGDFEPSEEDAGQGLVDLRPKSFLALFCDGQVRTLSGDADRKMLRWLFQKNDSERVRLDHLILAQ